MFLPGHIKKIFSGSSFDFFENNFQLVKIDDLMALISGVSYYLNTSEEISSRIYMINYFSLKIMVQKIMAVYKKLLT